jgi:hypothetical protein
MFVVSRPVRKNKYAAKVGHLAVEVKEIFPLPHHGTIR